MSGRDGELLGIGAAAAGAGVSERSLRYYQQIGLLTPSASTPGGMRRYSQSNLDRVARIRELKSLLGLDLDTIAIVLRSEDRLAEIREAWHHQHTTAARPRERAAESLQLQEELRATVQAKREAMSSFLADLNARITRTRELIAELGAPAGSVS